MRRPAEFTAVLRGGRTAARDTLVLHYRPGLLPDGGAHIGLVIGNKVGSSVVRHRVTRRLRAQLSPRIALLPPRSGLVVRALPAAASASFRRLGDDLDAALARLLHRPGTYRDRDREVGA